MFIDKLVKIWTFEKTPGKPIRNALNDVLQVKIHNYEMSCQKSSPYSFLSSLQNFQFDFLVEWKKKAKGSVSQNAIGAFVSELNYIIETIKERSEHFDAIKIYLKLKDREGTDPLSKRVFYLFQKVEDAENKINNVVQNASNLATKKTTDTSVTILGMFSGDCFNCCGWFVLFIFGYQQYKHSRFLQIDFNFSTCGCYLF